jgi:hypothetical protein
MVQMRMQGIQSTRIFLIQTRQSEKLAERIEAEPPRFFFFPKFAEVLSAFSKDLVECFGIGGFINHRWVQGG